MIFLWEFILKVWINILGFMKKLGDSFYHLLELKKKTDIWEWNFAISLIRVVPTPCKYYYRLNSEAWRPEFRFKIIFFLIIHYTEVTYLFHISHHKRALGAQKVLVQKGEYVRRQWNVTVSLSFFGNYRMMPICLSGFRFCVVRCWWRFRLGGFARSEGFLEPVPQNGLAIVVVIGCTFVRTEYHVFIVRGRIGLAERISFWRVHTFQGAGLAVADYR